MVSSMGFLQHLQGCRSDCLLPRPCASRTAYGLWLREAEAQLQDHFRIYSWISFGGLTFRVSWTMAKRDRSWVAGHFRVHSMEKGPCDYYPRHVWVWLFPSSFTCGSGDRTKTKQSCNWILPGLQTSYLDPKTPIKVFLSVDGCQIIIVKGIYFLIQWRHHSPYITYWFIRPFLSSLCTYRY